MKRLAGLVALAGVLGAWGCGGKIDASVGNGGSGAIPSNDSGVRPGVDGGHASTGDVDSGHGAPPARDCAVPVPIPVQPLDAHHGVTEVCAAVGGTPAPSDTVDALQATIVGRWIACAGSAPGTTGIEIDGRGRYQYLTYNPDQTVAVQSPKIAGRYDFYGETQVNMTDDGGSWVTFNHVTFPTGTDSMRMENDGSTTLYARIAPSLANGSDNPPPLSDGTCSMAGTWDVQSSLPGSNKSGAGSFTFDALGNFMGGEYGADLCASHVFTGKYQLSPGLFEITESEGMGCPYDAFWIPQFDASCTKMTITGTGDNCTGGRSYIDYDGVMMRRP